MKRILMLGAALTLVSGVAFAESPGISGVDTATPVAANDDGGAAPADFDRDGPDGKWRHGWRRGDGGPGGPDGFRGPRPGFGMMSKGPAIVLEHHGNRIAVKCAKDDSTQQCVEAVMNLMDRVAQTMHRHGPDGGPPRDRDQRPDDSDQ